MYTTVVLHGRQIAHARQPRNNRHNSVENKVFAENPRHPPPKTARAGILHRRQRQAMRMFSVRHLDIFAGEITGSDSDKLRSLSRAVVRRDKVRLRIIQEPPLKSIQI